MYIQTYIWNVWHFSAFKFAIGFVHFPFQYNDERRFLSFDISIGHISRRPWSVFIIKTNYYFIIMWWGAFISYFSQDTALCDNVCQWLAAGRWFSPGTPVSSNNKTDRHDINWNIVESGVKQHNPPNPYFSLYILI